MLETYSDDDVDHDAEGTFKVIGLLVAQEIANNNDSENEDDGVEDFEVEILGFISFRSYSASRLQKAYHMLMETPADKDHQRSVE